MFVPRPTAKAARDEVDGRVRREQLARPKPASPSPSDVPMSCVARATAIAKGAAGLGSRTVARPRGAVSALPIGESFADVGRPATPARAVTPGPFRDLAARQATAAHNLLKGAAKRRTCLSLSTLEPESSSLADALAVVTAHQEAGRRKKGAHRLSFASCAVVESADLFVVLQAVQSSVPWVSTIDITTLRVAAGTERLVAQQLLRAADEQRLVGLSLGPDAARVMPPSFAQDLDRLLERNRDRRGTSQRRKRKPPTAHEDAPLNDPEDVETVEGASPGASVAGWADDDLDATGDEENQAAAMEQARVILEENLARYAVMRAYIAETANAVAAARRVLQPG